MSYEMVIVTRTLGAILGALTIVCLWLLVRFILLKATEPHRMAQYGQIGFSVVLALCGALFVWASANRGAFSAALGLKPSGYAAYYSEGDPMVAYPTLAILIVTAGVLGWRSRYGIGIGLAAVPLRLMSFLLHKN